MAIEIFRRPFCLRHFTFEDIEDGYAVSTYTDKSVKLNVQPDGLDQFQTTPSGQRVFKKLKAWGDDSITPANQETGQPADWLWYSGYWYRCTSAVHWDHTMLAHWRSEWNAVPESELAENLTPPTIEGDWQ